MKACSTAEAATVETPVPVCVDLDGCLIQTDLTIESALSLLAEKPMLIPEALRWLRKGRALFKSRCAEQVRFDPALLPYNPGVLDYLRTQARAGRPLILATASNRALAVRIADHLGVFQEVVASDEDTNAKGATKRDLLLARFGRGGFDYLGNSLADWTIFREARLGIVAGNSLPLSAFLTFTPREKGFTRLQWPVGVGFGAIVRGLRPKQWAKNILLFVPLILAHKLFDAPRLWEALLGAASFCMAASSAYLLNDLLDLRADRLHPVKRSRPLASGALSLNLALMLMPVLAVLALDLSIVLGPAFFLFSAIYFTVTVGYSVYIKRLPLLDIIALSGLYIVRIIAGGSATKIPVSPWLAAFAGSLFLSLAFLKRFTELRNVLETNRNADNRRGYQLSDIEQIRSFGAASGYLSALVLAFYLNGADARGLYHRPDWLWIVCGILVYWISRMWILAGRGQMSEDPVIFATRDWPSYVALALCGVGMVLAL